MSLEGQQIVLLAESLESGKCSAEREVRREVDRASHCHEGRRSTADFPADTWYACVETMTPGSVLLGHGANHA